MRRLIKFLHTLGAIGMIAAMVHGEWASLRVLLAIALINVAL